MYSLVNLNQEHVIGNHFHFIVVHCADEGVYKIRRRWLAGSAPEKIPLRRENTSKPPEINQDPAKRLAETPANPTTMAGRLPFLTTRVSQLSISPLNAPTRSPLLSLLAPQFHQQQTRNASILSTLSDTPGAYNKRIRRGRGPASGKGKTSGRGHKGQKQHGKVPYNFNGGQTPERIVHGERGFTN